MRRFALLRLPFHANPSQVSELDYPRNGISGNGELVVENCSLIHNSLAWNFLILQYAWQERSRVQCNLSLVFRQLLVLALDAVADA